MSCFCPLQQQQVQNKIFSVFDSFYVVYGVVSWVMGMTSGKKKQNKRTANKGVDESQNDDWLKGTPAAARFKKQ